MKEVVLNVLNFIKTKKWYFIIALLIIILIISFIKFVYPNIRKAQLNNKEWLEDHITITQNYDMGDNIYAVKKPEDVDIYTLKYQNIIEEKINDLLNQNSYTFENPLIIYNPYGTNNNSVNIYYTSEENETLSYEIEAKNTENYKATLNQTEGPNYEYQIIGLVNSQNNIITLTKNEETKQVSINLKEVSSKADTQLEVTEGTSTESLTNGLFALLGHDKNYNSNIYLYDNNGTLRAELPLKSYRTDRIVFIEDSMIYSYKKNGFIRVNAQGKITNIYNIKGYTMHHDFVYDQTNNKLVILANKNNADTIEDIVITLDLQTNKTEEILDMKNYLIDYYDTAITPEQGNTYGGDELDWIHLNSLQVVNGKDIILSAREISSIIRINDIYDTPSLKYILTDESMENESIYQEYTYSKVGNFTSHAGQHTVTYTEDSSLKEGQYYVSIYNNNYGGARTRPDFDWSNYEGVGTYEEGTNSMYYKYLVDENKQTYTLVDSFNVPYSSIVSSIEYYQDNIITSSGRSHSFGEYDSQGNLIREYSYNSKKYAYRAFKYTFEDFWFQKQD